MKNSLRIRTAVVRRARIQRFATLCLGLLSFSIPGVTRASDPLPLIPGSWTLTFQDEFDGTTVDGSKWRLGGHYAGIAGAGANSPDNITVADGKLQLLAEQRATTFSGTSYSYAAGEVSTFFNYRQQYGYIEARLKYPAVTGLWPAFWLMPDRGTYGSASAFRRSFLKFDLSAAGPLTVNSAILKLKISSLQTNGTNNLVVMKVADDTWSESTITWSNQPARDPIWITQKWNNQVSPGDEISIDVTDYVAQQVAGDKTISLALADTFMRAQLLTFHSREAATAGDRPQLIVNGTAYEPSADATVRWGSYVDTNYGSATTLDVKDDYADSSTTWGTGMEVDIMESLGNWGDDVTQHALHWDGYGAYHKSVSWPDITFESTPDGFHTYGLYWEAGLFAFYVDGIRTAEYTSARVMSAPAYFLLSLQLGGWGGNNPGAQVDQQVMEVDWVRAWSGTRADAVTVTVDNTDTANTLSTGTWSTSSHSAGYHGTNYAHDANTAKGTKSFTFLPPLMADGEYLVYARWTADANRATHVPIDIVGPAGTASTVTVNQQANGGSWQLLGLFDLAVLTAEATVRTTGTNGYVIADAMCFVPTPTTGTIEVDNDDITQTSSTGTWTTSTGSPGYLGTNYVHDGNTAKGSRSFSFEPTIPAAGDYLVYARWTADGNRANNVPVDIVRADGSVDTLVIDQTVNGSEWIPLGVYPLSPTNAAVTFRTTGTSGYVIADGVRVVPIVAP